MKHKDELLRMKPKVVVLDEAHYIKSHEVS